MKNFLFILFLALLCSCTANPISRMVVKNGSSTVTKPPVIYGNVKELERGLNHRILAEYNLGNKNAAIPLEGALKMSAIPNDNKNSGDLKSVYHSQEEPMNFIYELQNNNFGMQYFLTNKYDNFYYGSGAGFQDFPYAFFDIGVNKKYFEIGAAFLIGYDWQTIEYDGYFVNEEGDTHDPFEESKTNSGAYFGAYIHSSIFLKPFALNYSASISRARSDLLYEDGCGFMSDMFPGYCTEYTFDFPALIMQDIGIAYSYQKIGCRISLNKTTDSNFKKSYFGTNFQVAVFL